METGAVFQQDMAFESKSGGRGATLACMVGLGRTLGNDRIRAALYCVGHQEFEFTGLVAAR